MNCLQKGETVGSVCLNLLSSSRARPSAGDNRNEHWRHGHTPAEHITSTSNGLHGNHLYDSISGYAVDRPLALTKSSHSTGVGGREWSVMSGTVERQQVCQLIQLIVRVSGIKSKLSKIWKMSLSC